MEDSYASEKLLADTEASSDIFDDSGSRKPHRPWWFRHSVIALSCSIIVNIAFIVSHFRFLDLDYLTTKYAQRYWSPIMDSIPIPYKPFYFNVTLFSDSIYRQDASPEVHQAWLDLGLTATQIILEKDAKRVGFTPGMVKLRASEGGGFIGQMEVFHNLHCLDTLRQGLYFNYNYYHTRREGVWGRSDTVVRKHMGMPSSRFSELEQLVTRVELTKTGHCLDLLRLSLQCTADIGMVGMMWVNATGTPVEFAKFVGEHQCRDFEAVKAWALEHDEKGHTELRDGDEIADKFP